MSKGYAFLLFLLMLPCIAFGEGFGSTGSQSLLRLQNASTLNPKRLDLKADLNFFTKLGDYLGSGKPANYKAVNYWVVQSNVLATYGLAEHFDATFTALHHAVSGGFDELVGQDGEVYLDDGQGGGVAPCIR